MPDEPAPRLENRLAPDDAYGRPEHPLRELAWLLAATLTVLAAVVLAVGLAARSLAPKVPFSAELALAEKLLKTPPPANAEAAARAAALQALADRVAAGMQLPPDMVIVVNDIASPLVNAYATIGGRIRLYHGLMGRLEDEAELAALLAHEIAHVKHRHVAANLGRGLTLALLLSVVSTDAGAAVAHGVLNQATSLALLGYSREQEREADTEALLAVASLYGHAGGVIGLMQRLADEEQRRGGGGNGGGEGGEGGKAGKGSQGGQDERNAAGRGIELLRTHPHTTTRLQELRDLAQRRGIALTGASVPLPPTLRVPRLPPVQRPPASK